MLTIQGLKKKHLRLFNANYCKTELVEVFMEFDFGNGC